MAFVSIEDAKEVRERAGILNNSIDILLADLLGKDIETQEIIKQRDDAKTNKQQSEYIELDQKLIEALKEIEDMEKQIVAYLSKNMNFDDVKNKSKVEYMMSELQDKDIENKFLEYKLNLTKDQYRDEATKINRERDSLIVKRDAIQKELDELRRKDNPDQEAIKRKEADLERIEKEIKKLQKQLDVMKKIKDLDKSGVEDLIKENNKIINHNMKSLNLKGVDPKNYSYATDLLTQITERRKIDEAIFPINSDYEKFKEILSAEEFYYLSKYYENEKDNPLRFNHSGKIGLFESIKLGFNKNKITKMLVARYPNLDTSSKEFKEIYKQQKDALWVLMKSGVTPDMLSHVYRELDTDVKVFEKNSNDRSEWLRSLRIENQEQVHGDEERTPEEPEKKPDEPIKPTPTPEPEPEPANPDKPEEKNDTGDFLKGLETLRLTKEQEEAIRKANPKNIGELNDLFIQLGILLVLKDTDRDRNPDGNDNPSGSDNPDRNAGTKNNKSLFADRGVMFDNDDIMRAQIEEIEDEKEPFAILKMKEELRKIGFSETMIKEFKQLHINSVEELMVSINKKTISQEIIQKFNKKACTNLLELLKENNIKIGKEQQKILEERSKTKVTKKPSDSKKNPEFPGFTPAQLKKIEDRGITSYKELIEKLEEGEEAVKKIFTTETSLNYLKHYYQKHNKTDSSVFEQIENALQAKQTKKGKNKKDIKEFIDDGSQYKRDGVYNAENNGTIPSQVEKANEDNAENNGTTPSQVQKANEDNDEGRSGR